MIISLDNLQLRFEPFPIGLARPVIDPGLYEELAAAFPPVSIFEDYGEMKKPGSKFTLSEKENRRVYEKFVRANPLWRDFHREVKSEDFIYGVLTGLLERDVDLGYRRLAPSRRARLRVRDLIRGRPSMEAARLTSRFEFSALPADGGEVVPHTDSVTKIVTLVLSMAREGEWNPDFGGGTDLNRPKDTALAFNYVNRLAGFDQMEVLDTFSYQPNQCLVFVKTFNSWHSVRPMTGRGSPLLRKTLTIVIEAPR